LKNHDVAINIAGRHSAISSSFYVVREPREEEEEEENRAGDSQNVSVPVNRWQAAEEFYRTYGSTALRTSAAI